METRSKSYRKTAGEEEECTYVSPLSDFSSKSESWTEYILINYRWAFVCIFLLPISFVYNIVMYVRTWIIFKMNSAPRMHDQHVRDVQKQVREWNEDGRKNLMCTARPNWANVSFREVQYKSKFRNISIKLMDILEVNTEAGKPYVRVEPMVTMGRLTAMLAHTGWSLPVVPELDDLTVGGLACGEGVESSCHRYGLFQNIIQSCDVVLSDASLVHCSKDENSDLFYSIPWSHGTLGFLVAVNLDIIQIKKYIKLRYRPVYSMAEMVKVFTKEALDTEQNDFIEGIVYSKDTAVIMTGTLTNDCDSSKLNSLGRWYKPWFFEHARATLKEGGRLEYLPYRDYCHRHTRAIFWEMQDIIPFGNAVWFRYLFGWMIPPSISLLKLTSTPTIRKMYEEHQLIQDIMVPIQTLTKSIEFLHDEVEIYPLWLCPYVQHDLPGMVHPTKHESEMFVDIGIYGTPKSCKWEAVVTSRKVEEYTREVKGYQMLYGECYQTEKEFQEMFDHSLYKQLRKRLQCEDAFPEVYRKICRNA